ncbi:MAG: transcriptional regulator [Woeseiaceae bacterium]
MLFSMIYAFGSLEIDLAKVELRDNGESRSIEPQVFALIAYLAEHRDRMVSRDELFEKLWEGRVVSDSALASRIKSARRALGDDGRTQAIIKTVHGQGLRFIADVQVQQAPVAATSPAVSEEPERSAPGAAPDAIPSGFAVTTRTRARSDDCWVSATVCRAPSKSPAISWS